MATVNELSATARPKAGKGAARAVRREGRVPGVIYGDSKEAIGISLDFKDLRQRIYAGRFLNTVFNVDQAPGIKRGGTVNIVTHTISVLCPADDIPQGFDVDITGLEINYSKHLRDIQSEE